RTAATAARARPATDPARRLAGRLAAAAACFLAATILLVDRGIADLRSPLRRVAAALRALLDVVRLTLLLARIFGLASSRHTLESAHHVPVSRPRTGR